MPIHRRIVPGLRNVVALVLNGVFQTVAGLDGVAPGVAIQVLTIINTDANAANGLEFRFGAAGAPIPLPSNGLGNGEWNEPIPPDGLVVDPTLGALQIRATNAVGACVVLWYDISDNSTNQ